METMGVNVEDVLLAVSAILHIGNITFVEAGAEKAAPEDNDGNSNKYRQ